MNGVSRGESPVGFGSVLEVGGVYKGTYVRWNGCFSVVVRPASDTLMSG
jgi:hypothetical protein